MKKQYQTLLDQRKLIPILLWSPHAVCCHASMGVLNTLNTSYSMQKSVQAALLSAFVFPGAGHMYLKRYIAGSILACSAMTSLFFIVAYAVERAMQIVEEIQRGEVLLDVKVITELVSRQPVGDVALVYNIALGVFIISWLASIVDAYRVGRLTDKGEVSDK